MAKSSEPERLTDAEQSDTDVKTRWEQAFLQFENTQQERRKFIKRLKQLGVEQWDKKLRIVELFCGRGNGLFAWESLGFNNIEGLDLSEELVRNYTGKARCHVGDVCNLPFPDQSFDVVCVQGGLHHLHLMDDFEKTLSEIHRILRPDGRFVVVEPWQTLFLRFVHSTMKIGLVRKLSKRVATYALLCELERETLEPWLNKPKDILKQLQMYNKTVTLRMRFGKLMFVGIRKNKPE